MILRKAIISLFCIFITMFMFIFVLRLAQGKRGFLGFNDLFSYFESVDFNKPLRRFSNDISTLSKSWQSFGNQNNGVIVQGTFGQIYQDLPGYSSSSLFESHFFKTINAIAETIAFPFKLIGDILLMIVDYLVIFTGFISWFISFEGYIVT